MKTIPILINGKLIETRVINGVQRLPKNRLLAWMVHVGVIDLNRIQKLAHRSRIAAWFQGWLYQRIGCSVCGYGGVFPSHRINNSMWSD